MNISELKELLKTPRTPHQYLTKEELGEGLSEAESKMRQLIERVEKLSEALGSGISGRPYQVDDIIGEDEFDLAKKVLAKYGPDAELK